MTWGRSDSMNQFWTRVTRLAYDLAESVQVSRISIQGHCESSRAEVGVCSKSSRRAESDEVMGTLSTSREDPSLFVASVLDQVTYVINCTENQDERTCSVINYGENGESIVHRSAVRTLWRDGTHRRRRTSDAMHQTRRRAPGAWAVPSELPANSVSPASAPRLPLVRQHRPPPRCQKGGATLGG